MNFGPHGAEEFSLEASLANLTRGQALSTFLMHCGGWWPGVRAPGLLVLAPPRNLLISSSVNKSIGLGSNPIIASPGISIKTPPSFPKRKQKHLTKTAPHCHSWLTSSLAKFWNLGRKWSPLGTGRAPHSVR